MVGRTVIPEGRVVTLSETKGAMRAHGPFASLRVTTAYRAACCTFECRFPYRK